MGQFYLMLVVRFTLLVDVRIYVVLRYHASLTSVILCQLPFLSDNFAIKSFWLFKLRDTSCYMFLHNTLLLYILTSFV